MPTWIWPVGEGAVFAREQNGVSSATVAYEVGTGAERWRTPEPGYLWPWHVEGDLPRPGPRGDVWGHRKQSPGNLENALALIKGPESGVEQQRAMELER